MNPPSVIQRKTHILTVALEDYFHGPAFSKVISRKRWGHFETRFEENCLSVLDKLDDCSAQATFFVNSWVARKRPSVLQEVIRRGHEIALAGQRGVSFRHLSRPALVEQVQRDRDILEQQTSHKVLGFRVTDVFLGPDDLWALEELASLGFKYDSSLSPFLRCFHGQPWRQHIHKNTSAFGDIWEVPLSSERIAGLFVPYAGGNYFRQFPRWFTQRLLTTGSRHETNPLVLYFRLWDFDSDQPRIQTGSLVRDFRHYRNGERMIEMLNGLLQRFKFSSIAEYLNLEVPQVAIEAEKRMEPATLGFSRRLAGRSTPVSVIVPCFNEEEGIAFLASNLHSLRAELQSQFDAEFILVDDGSSDLTWTLLQKHFGDDANVKLIRHPQNRGVSAAIMTGLKHSREVACSMDCDCSYDPSVLKPMLQLLTSGVDLVTASPYHPEGKVLNVPSWRLLLSRASSALYRQVTGQKLHTFTACVRVYRRSAAVNVSLRYTGFLGVAELLSRMALAGKSIVEHPATLEVRIFGQSKMKVARTIMGHLRLLSELSRVRFRSGDLHLGEPQELAAVGFPVIEPAKAEVEKS